MTPVSVIVDAAAALQGPPLRVNVSTLVPVRAPVATQPKSLTMAPAVKEKPAGKVTTTVSVPTTIVALGVKPTVQVETTAPLGVVVANVTLEAVTVVVALAKVAVPSRAKEATMAMATNLVTTLMGLRRDILPCPVDE